MRDYKEVIANRYACQVETDFSPQMTLKWMGAQLRISQVFAQLLKRLGDSGMNLTEARVLDLGCGGGRWSRFVAEITGRPENITGLDLCGPRIEYAKRTNPAITYRVADIVEDPIDGTFDIILAFDVFMHLSERNDIQKALRNIHDSLSEHGILVFLDAWAKTHFGPSNGSDSCGFRPEEIIELAQSEGLSPVFKMNLFRIFLGGKTSDQYYSYFRSELVRIAELLYPGRPGNFFVVFERGAKK